MICLKKAVRKCFSRKEPIFEVKRSKTLHSSGPAIAKKHKSASKPTTRPFPSQSQTLQQHHFFFPGPLLPLRSGNVLGKNKQFSNQSANNGHGRPKTIPHKSSGDDYRSPPTKLNQLSNNHIITPKTKPSLYISRQLQTKVTINLFGKKRVIQHKFRFNMRKPHFTFRSHFRPLIRLSKKISP